MFLTHEQLLNMYGYSQFFKLKPLTTSPRKTFFCNECFQMSWELQKIEVLYRHIKSQAKLFYCLNYKSGIAAEKMNLVKAKKLTPKFESFHCDHEFEMSDILQAETCDENEAFMNKNRINFAQKKTIIKVLHHCILRLRKYEQTVVEILSPYLFIEDISEYKNVNFLTSNLLAGNLSPSLQM